MSAPLTIDWHRFADALKAERTLRHRSVRQAAAALGISAATLCRAELGQEGREISAVNYLILCRYLGRSPMDFACEFHGKQSEIVHSMRGVAS